MQVVVEFKSQLLSLRMDAATRFVIEVIKFDTKTSSKHFSVLDWPLR